MLAGADAREILRFSLAIQKSAKVRREVYTEELDKKHPSAYYFFKQRKDIKQAQPSKKSLLERIGLSSNVTKYAPQAKQLTEEFLKKFKPDAVKGWSCTIALNVEKEGDADGFCYSITINNGMLTAKEEEPHKWNLKINVSAGVWAAILLKKKRIEMAYLQGTIKQVKSINSSQ